MGSDGKLRILFLCTGNSCRSQMAEGFTRALKGDTIEVWSAGIEAHGLNPYAVKVMAEVGIDISGQKSKTTAELPDVHLDYVITVCDHAREMCPLFLKAVKQVHAGFEDPAAASGTEEEIMAVFREVRDQIRAFVENMPAILDEPA
jgi:arsenate reductase (thioredoxin)